MSDSTTQVRISDFRPNTDGPVWSSDAMRRCIQQCANEGNFDSLYRELFISLSAGCLTQTRAHFVRECVRVSFSVFRREYDQTEFEFASLQDALSPAQAYFLMLVLPPDKFTAKELKAITVALASTEFFEEAVTLLSDEIKKLGGSVIGGQICWMT